MSEDAGVSINFSSNKPYSYVETFDFLRSVGWKDRKESGYDFTIVDKSEIYNWDKHSPSSEKMRKILEQEQRKRNGVGVTLYYQDTEIGINVVMYENFNIIFSYLINRKTLENEFCYGRKKTDMEWYQKRLVDPLKDHFSDFIKEIRFIESYW